MDKQVFTYKKKITAEEIDDIMVTALEGGINYWCSKAEVKGNEFLGSEYASGVISKGGSLILHYDEGKVTLTLKKLLKGLSMSEKFDRDYYDALDVDAVIQYAVFGVLIYG